MQISGGEIPRCRRPHAGDLLYALSPLCQSRSVQRGSLNAKEVRPRRRTEGISAYHEEPLDDVADRLWRAEGMPNPSTPARRCNLDWRRSSTRLVRGFSRPSRCWSREKAIVLRSSGQAYLIIVTLRASVFPYCLAVVRAMCARLLQFSSLLPCRLIAFGTATSTQANPWGPAINAKGLSIRREIRPRIGDFFVS